MVRVATLPALLPIRSRLEIVYPTSVTRFLPVKVARKPPVICSVLSYDLYSNRADRFVAICLNSDNGRPISQ